MNPILAKLTHYHPNQPITYGDLYASKPGDCFNLFEAVRTTTGNEPGFSVVSCKSQIMTNDGNYIELNCLPNVTDFSTEKFHSIGGGGLVFFDENHDLDRTIGDEDVNSDHITWLENCSTPPFKYELPPENSYTLKEFLSLPVGSKVKVREYNYFTTLTRLYKVSNTSGDKTRLEPLDATSSLATALNFFVKDKGALPTKVLFPKRSPGRFCVIFPAN